MLKQLEEIKSSALQELGSINNIKQLEAWQVRYLGKKSQLTKILRSLATLPLDERKTVGAYANEVKVNLENSLEQKEQVLREAELAASAKREAIDITLPSRPFPVGHLHP
ncbi:unnamed protein product, partial [marine sediment metagenome]